MKAIDEVLLGVRHCSCLNRRKVEAVRRDDVYRELSNGRLVDWKVFNRPMPDTINEVRDWCWQIGKDVYIGTNAASSFRDKAVPRMYEWVTFGATPDVILAVWLQEGGVKYVKLFGWREGTIINSADAAPGSAVEAVERSFDEAHRQVSTEALDSGGR